MRLIFLICLLFLTSCSILTGVKEIDCKENGKYQNWLIYEYAEKCRINKAGPRLEHEFEINS